MTLNTARARVLIAATKTRQHEATNVEQGLRYEPQNADKHVDNYADDKCHLHPFPIAPNAQELVSRDLHMSSVIHSRVHDTGSLLNLFVLVREEGRGPGWAHEEEAPESEEEACGDAL